ncbi:MAG: C40 family peptidase [Porphyromonas sp.]|nr:C40 family peptidase [Porphyromonas sp.]
MLLILAMGSTSCRTYKQPVRRVLLPSEPISTGMSGVEAEQLAANLSKDLKLKVQLPEDNLELYSFADDWMRTPYRYGGTTQRGTDCSGFVWRLYQTVYKINVGRHSSATLMANTQRVKKQELKEGDLVFFNINNRRGGAASHVGVYLKDDKFIHATTRSGVIISSLNEPYYRRTYIGAGRVQPADNR